MFTAYHFCINNKGVRESIVLPPRKRISLQRGRRCRSNGIHLPDRKRPQTFPCESLRPFHHVPKLLSASKILPMAFIPPFSFRFFLPAQPPGCSHPFFQYPRHLKHRSQAPRLPSSISAALQNAQPGYGRHPKQTNHPLHSR